MELSLGGLFSRLAATNARLAGEASFITSEGNEKGES